MMTRKLYIISLFLLSCVACSKESTCECHKETYYGPSAGGTQIDTFISTTDPGESCAEYANRIDPDNSTRCYDK